MGREEIRRIESDIATLLELQAAFDDVATWNKFIDQPKKKLYTKQEAGMKLIT